MNKYAMTIARQMLSSSSVKPVPPDKGARIRAMLEGNTANMDRWLPKQASEQMHKTASERNLELVYGIIKTAEAAAAQGQPALGGGFWENIINALKNWWSGLGAQGKERRKQDWTNNRIQQLQSRIKKPDAYATEKWGLGDYAHAIINPYGAALQTVRNKVFGNNRNRTKLGAGDYALWAVPGIGPAMGAQNLLRVKLNKWTADARNRNYNRQMENAKQQAQNEAEIKF